MVEYRIDNDKLFGPVRRNAALFIAIVVAALILGVGQVWFSTKSYTSEVGIRYDGVLLNKYAFAPTMDEVIAQARVQEELARIKTRSGVSGSLPALASNIRVFKSPTLSNHLIVSVRWSNPADAEKIARETSMELIGFVERSLGKVKQYFQEQVKEATHQRNVIAGLEKEAVVSKSEPLQTRVISANAISEINSQILEGEQRLNELNSIFVIDMGPTTGKSVPLMEMFVGGLLSAVLGLFLGYVAVFVLDRSKRRG